MNWKQFRLANNLMGWLVFAIATVVYLMTISPTANLWDCAEFVACDYRLEIGHPPGAPFYMLVYNVISHLAGDPQQAGLMANATSALLSGLTILFMYWTVTHMMRRVLTPEFRREGRDRETITRAQSVVILGGALVASLIYTFSDTFWFSAVEAEVYAFSSLFTAVVFWLMFMWDERADEPRADRWLILIAYLMGLSIGVHLLNLLCLPAMALVYYYRRAERPTLRGAVLSVGVSFVLIVVMMYGIVQGVPKMAGRFDLFFVNTLGLSFNSGLYTYLFLLAAVLAWSVYESARAISVGEGSSRMRLSVLLSIVLMGIPFFGSGVVLGLALSTALGVFLFSYKGLKPRFVHSMQLGLMVIAIGFSSYGVILVRAIADTPMNENAPDNPFSLRYYLAREQYGSAPLIYGPTFASRHSGVEDGEEVMGKAPREDEAEPDRYVVRYRKPEPRYDASQKMLFPRVYSPSHTEGYNRWMNRRADDYTPPTFGENLLYFWNYQVNHMYWRYFLWNFVGRQNDLPADGGRLRGNAITGLDFIDRYFVGSSEGMPEWLKGNKGRNVYYALPLILGLVGMFYQISRTRLRRLSNGKQEEQAVGLESFWIVFMLFFMTGLAIVLYINQKPNEPRERDYAYAGSFYAFAMWTAFGVAALWSLLRRAKLSSLTSATVATLIALLIPIQMAGQNWDDHDRSGRTLVRDIGINYLESCEPNAILFCFGDNDTFPLWYIQDVEGVRTDVRTVNMSYLTGEWYVDQMKRATYEGKPLPLRLMKPSYYYYHEAAYLDPKASAPMSVPEALTRVVDGSSRTARGEAVLPSNTLYVDVDSAEVASRLFASEPDLARRVLPRLPISVKAKRYLDRSGLSILDLIESNRWERPLYWTFTSPRNAYDNMPLHMMQTGMAYQLLPISLEGSKADSLPALDAVRIEQMYDNVMNRFVWGGADNPSIYFDATGRETLQGVRVGVYEVLARALINRGDKERAQRVLQRCLEVIRPEVVPYDFRSIRLAQSLYEAEMKPEADKLIEAVGSDAMKSLTWYFRLSDHLLEAVYKDREIDLALETALMALQLSKKYGSQVMEPYTQQLAQYSKLLLPASPQQGQAR